MLPSWMRSAERGAESVLSLGRNLKRRKAREIRHPLLRNSHLESKAGTTARGNYLAPQVGLEPTTLRLTAECSTIELLRSNAGRLLLNHYTKPASTCQICSFASECDAAFRYNAFHYESHSTGNSIRGPISRSKRTD